jgi:hypothetical protein
VFFVLSACSNRYFVHRTFAGIDKIALQSDERVRTKSRNTYCAIIGRKRKAEGTYKLSGDTLFILEDTGTSDTLWYRECRHSDSLLIGSGHYYREVGYLRYTLPFFIRKQGW